jgi:hypothetical protein
MKKIFLQLLFLILTLGLLGSLNFAFANHHDTQPQLVPAPGPPKSPTEIDTKKGIPKAQVVAPMNLKAPPQDYGVEKSQELKQNRKPTGKNTN